MQTKRDIVAWCEQQGLELEHDHDGMWHHVHVYCPGGKIFGAHGLHNLALWDSHDAPDWRWVGRELLDGDLQACHEDDCEWCHECSEPGCEICQNPPAQEAPRAQPQPA